MNNLNFDKAINCLITTDNQIDEYKRGELLRLINHLFVIFTNNSRYHLTAYQCSEMEHLISSIQNFQKS